jgi:Cof subfamily protein (haloacid dehalogenase superfamily)
MLRFHRRLELTGPIVSCNGAQVIDSDTHEVMHQRLVPADLAAEIVAEADKRGITQNYYHTDGGLYVREKTGWTDLYQHRTGSEVNIHRNIGDFHGESALKIIWIDAAEKIAELYQEFAARYSDQLYVTTTDPEYLEFMAKGVSKAAGLEVVAGKLGIKPEEVITFGDGNNDIPMLQWAGLGIAMADARPAAKEAANLVAPPGNPETSFARAVEIVLQTKG